MRKLSPYGDPSLARPSLINRSRGPSVVTLIATFLFVNPGNLQAQKDDSEIIPSRTCESVQRIVGQASSTGEYRRALRNVRSCPTNVAAELLVAEWRKPHNDSVSARLLGEASGRIRDKRVFVAVARVAAERSRSRMERLAAFRALAMHYDPTVVLLFRRVDEPGLSGLRYVSIGSLDHPVTEEGQFPLGPATRAEILRVLTDVGAGDSDSTLRTIATQLARKLKEF